MKEINNPNEVLKFCRVLSAPIRIEMIKLLIQNKTMNLNKMAVQLGVTNGALTSHIKMLYEEGIIDIKHAPGKRGIQKSCRLKQHQFLIDFSREYTPGNSYETSIPIGSYHRYQVFPTCGIATRNEVIGVVDDPRYFDDPGRNEAGILWFTKGFVEYRIPNYLKPSCRIDELQISFELSSEAPGVCENWPSDIHFHLNDTHLGSWISPGDYGGVKGLYTPAWWFPNWNQYGLLKLITINWEGTFLDGRKISDTTLGYFNLTESSTLDFRLSVTDESKPAGGLTLFGSGFGNYNQDIHVRMLYHGDSG